MERDPLDDAWEAAQDPLDAAWEQANATRRSGISNVVRGLAQGLGTAGTSTIRAIGTLTGSDRLKRFAEESEREMQEFYDPQGTAGAVGRGVGRVAGELATGIVGGGAGVKAATRLSPRLAQALAGASRLQRGAATAAANLPIDIVQGAKEDEGLLLPGRAGAIAENVGLTGIAGALLPVARAARPARPTAEPPRTLPPGQYEMPGPRGPETSAARLLGAAGRTAPEVRPERMLPSASGPMTLSGRMTGPGIAQPGIGARVGQLPAATELPALPRGTTPMSEFVPGRTPAPEVGPLQGPGIAAGPARATRSALDDAIEQAERQAIQAEGGAGKAATRFPPSLTRLSDEDLRATAQAWQERLERVTQDANILNETEAINFFEASGGKAVGYRGAKRLTGVSEEARRAARFSEEQLNRLEELNLTPDDIKAWREAQKALPKVESQFQRLMGEMEKRNLSFVDGSTDFPFGANRPGVIAPELLAQAGAGTLGGVAGLATGDPNDPADQIGRAIIGFGFGLTAGRLVPRLARRGAARPVRQAAPTTPTVPLADGEDYLNVSRITDDPDLQRRLADNAAAVAEEGGVAARQPRRAGEGVGRLEEQESFEALRKRVAGTFGMSTDDFVARTARNERVGRVELLAAERTMADLTTETNRIFEQVRSGMLIGTERDRALEIAGRLQREAADLFGAYSKQVTETARDLSALRMGIRGTNNPLVWQARLEQLAKRALTPDEMAEAARLANAGDNDGLVDFAREVQKSTTIEKVNTLMKAGMLSRPSTQLANFVGNATMQALETAKDIPAVVLDRIAASFMAGGVRTKHFSIDRTFKAMLRGAEHGWQDAQKVWRRGYSDAAKVDVGREVNFGTGFGGRMANAMTRAVFRGMEGVDQLFLQSSFARALDEQARVLAKAEGLTGQAFTSRVEDILKNPPMEMSADAMLAAQLATFRNDTDISRAVLQLRERLPYNIGHFIAPFAKTPLNIAGRVIDYSPLGLTRSLSSLSRYVARGVPNAALQRKMVEDVARGSVGSAAILLGYFAAKNDKMTGFYPYDERTRNQWRASGKSEGALRVGDNWVQINRLSPFGNLMQIGAAMEELLDEEKQKDPADAFIAAFTAPAQTIVELPMVSSVRDVIEAVRKFGTPEAGEAGRQAIGRIVSGFIPGSSLLRGLAAGTDEFVRDPRAETAGEELKRRTMAAVPGLAQRLPVRLDPLGQPVRRDMGLIESLVSPVRRQRALTETDPVRAELERTNAVATPVARRKGEDDETFRARQERTGQVIYGAVQRFLQSDRYRNAATMNVDRLRRTLEEAGEDPDRLSDEAVRARYQGLLLEQVVARAKASVARQFTNPQGGSRGALIRALTR